MSPVRAVAVALSWLTVLPVPRRITDGPVDRRLGGAVLAAAPLVGVALGAVTSAVAWLLTMTALPAALIGTTVVALVALLTRGMHVDGLADTADGLGCYGPPERVSEVMRSGSAGPFGVMTLVLVVLVQVIGVASLADHRRWVELALAVAVGRVAAVVACRSTMRPSRPDGFGSLVVGTQRMSAIVWSVITVIVATTLAGMTTDPGRLDVTVAIRAGITVVVIGVFTVMFTRHCARRMGGLNGDVCGAVIELGFALSLLGLLT
ncbi:adenosylcobinamide-GDP ribazoletransferase [Williamsia sterculiae]|uniref:adenosylcobinamide-GDP ribazoletransferase n=1 Tax=Williamsia sterculiae TaxID=1344003 RepID=UPI00097064E9|nr:adenosylcobinamide-GDP ribazoletransferase [Williamsia sterculiae]